MKNILFVLTLLVTALSTFNMQAQCTRTSSFGSGTASVSCGTNVTLSTCNFATEYATIFSVVAGRTYRVNSSVATDWVTVRHTTAAGTVVSFAVQGTNWVAPVSGTYYAHFSTNSTCGTQTACRTTSVTTVSGCNCNNTSSFGSATINSSGSAVTISTCSYAGEYSTISGAVSGQTLRFSSSVSTDYITIRSGSASGSVVAQGTTPLIFTNSYTGTLYAHWNTNSSCGTQSACRTTTVQCTSCAPSAPANDLVANATTITCGSTTAGTTVNATSTGTYEGTSSCGVGQSQPAVWYQVAGNGQTMTASLCTTAWDSKISVYSGTATNLTCIGGNDDAGPACGGLSASFAFPTVSGTTYWIKVHGFSSTSAFSLGLSCVTPVPDPCASITSLSCGTASNYSLTGTTGAWNNFGSPWSTPGDEQVFSYTPTLTGVHSLSVSSSENYVDLFYKANSCAGSTGWTYVDDITGSATNNITLTAGVTYYFLLDDENTTATSGALTITCPQPAPNPCNNVTNIASCGVSQNINISQGDGVWNSFGGPFTTPGRENIYTYTPTVSASYPITVTNNGSGWIDLFVKSTASGCNSSSWTFIDDISGTATNNVTLTAGTTYYFLLDDEDNLGSSGSISIGCPCIGSTLDGTYTYSTPFTINGNTLGACNNSTLRASEDLTYRINIGCAGNYTFSSCNGATWDTYLYLTSAPGGGTIIASNDDNCSGGLQSNFTQFLSPGTYFISVEGFNDLNAGSFSLNVSGTGSAPTIIGTSTNVSCNGGNNGSITASVNGNGNPATATLNGTSFNGSVTSLTAGTYILSATNCWGTSTQTFTITQPSALSSSSSATAIACNGGSSVVTVTAAGGTAPYTGTGNYTVGAGTYSYTVTDANGCSGNTGGTITQPSALVASSSSTAILCNGGTSTVTVSATGGTAPYTGVGTYTVSAGTYSYTVVDANGCSATTTVTVTQPTPLVASITSNAPNGTICSGGTAVLTASISGGLGNVNYQWQYQNNIGNWVNVTGWSANNVATPLTNNRNASPSATTTYRIVVTSVASASCTIIASQLVTVIADPVITITPTNVTCFGASNGIAIASLSGGLPLNYGYNWYSNDGISSNNNPAGDGTLSVTGLFPAEWVINTTVVGGNFGCYAQASAFISEPNALIASSTATEILCNGGTSIATVDATGGTVPYTGTGSYSNLTAGTYAYTITDDNGCTANTTVIISQPSALATSYSTTDILCNGGTSILTLSASGGIAPYIGTGTFTVTAGTDIYSVSDANGCTKDVTITVSEPTQLTSSVSVTDYNGYGVSCFGSTDGEISLDALGGTIPYTGTGNYSNLSAGNYSYTITDANGCSITENITLDEPTKVNISTTNSDILCNGGTSDVTVYTWGGVNPYILNDGGNYSIPAGSYVYNVTDGNGCSASTTVNITEPSAVLASASSTPILCNGGTSDIIISGQGGTGLLNGTGTFTVTAGTYTYTVTDVNGCSNDVTIAVTEPTLLMATLTGSNYNGYGVSCFGSSDGQVVVTASGGTSPYAGTGNYNNLSAGSYSYLVTDANGCAVTESFLLIEPTEVNITATSTAILCNGGNSDVIVTTWGGVTPYAVNDGGNYSVPAGTYTYNLIDANGCSASETLSIGQPTPIIVNAGSDEVVFYGYTPMSCANLDADFSGGTPSYSVNWASINSGGGIGETLTACPINNEIYTVTVTDANGCSESDDLIICVVDVRCYAGNSGNQKVEMCQVPPGNPANAHTICIDESAVPAHLAIGCVLGACGELDNACGNTAAKQLIFDSPEAALTVAPNPVTNRTTVSITMTKADDYSIVLYDMMGKAIQTVYDGTLNGMENQVFDMDMSTMQNGIYILRVSSSNQIIKQVRVVKQ